MKKSRKLDFLPNVNNRYSIRKFTVGTASILLGVTLIFGASNDEAKAAEKEGATENVESSTASDGVTSDENLNREETTEVTKEEPANNEITTEASNIAKNEATSNSIEENDDTNENTPESTTEPTSNETDNEKAETETTPNETLEENTTSENPQTLKEENSTSTANEDNAESHKQIESNNNEKPEVETSTDSSNQTQSTVEKEDLSTNKNSDNSDKITLPNEAATEVDGNKEVIKANNNISNVSPDINRVTDRATAVDYYAKAANITTKEAEKVISDLNLDGDKLTAQELQFALINALANQQNANTPVATAFRAAPTAANRQATNLAAATPTALSIGSKEIIEADALANGYINSSTDASNAANTLSGRAWVVDRGTPATTENGLSPVPEGTKVYMQWIDKDGSVSPTYVASTTNKLSSSNASQVGPGAYAFDLRKAWVDALGNEHKYRAVSGQYYRLWIEDFQTVNGNTASMIRQAGGFFPGSYVNSVTNSSLGQFPLVGTNMQRTGVFMGVRPTNDYVTKERQDWIHDEQGPINNIAVSTNARNTVSGNVWLETGAGDYANSGTGPNDNNKDPQAEGYTVIMSSLTNEGAQAYKAQVDSLPEGERADAAKTLLTDHPEYISATVYGETDSEGRYTLRFPKDSLNPNYLYGYVTDPEGNIVKTYSSYTSPEFRKPNSNLSWTPQAAPGQNLVQNPMRYNVNFAVVPNTDINLNIVNFNNTDKPAIPGDTVNIDLTGGQLSPIPTNIEWRDKNGNVVQKTEDITSLTDGEQKGVLVVPETAKDGDVYTVYLVAGGNNVAADSFIVKITDERTYEPESNGVTKDYGTGVTTEDVINSVTVPNYPEDKGDYTVSVDNPEQLPNGNEAGTTNVGVTVTYPDGTTDHITVPVTIGEQADNDAYEPQSNGVNKDYGTGVTTEDVINSVIVPNYPEDKGDYTVAVDDPAQLPNGNEAGTTNVGVTVTYPDGTTDHITVPVTIGEQADNDAYQPQSNGVNKDYGTGVTADEVIGSVTVPNYPENKGDYTVAVDDPAQLPNGTQSGTTNVGVTVTYPDGTTDHITVPVTIGEQADNDAYQPQSNGVNKDYGTGVTADEVIGSVTVPNYPADKGTPNITVDSPEQLPNGNEAGTTNVGVTVTYPDGTTDHITVPVTIGEQADNDAYEPQSNGVNKDYGTGVTTEDVINSVTVPNYPEDKGDYTVSVDNPAQLPDGTQSGTTNVGVTVTYPDGTTDHITVPVTIGEQADNDAYQPESNGVNKDYGTGVTADEVIGSVTVPNYPEGKGTPNITVDSPEQLPNGNEAGTTNVGVTVTYPDGTTDHITVPVTIGEQSDNDAYEPQSNGVNKDYGTGVTTEDVINSVTVPNYPENKGDYTVTVDNPNELPNGNEAGTTNVGVTVTYPDGTTDHITVPVTIGEQADNDAYEPQNNGVNKDHGTGVTAEDIIGSVTIPNYPEGKEVPKVTIDDPSQLPDGSQSGTTNVGVTVTYPDGTTDHITVPVTIGEQADNDAYEPQSNGVNKDHGTGVTAEDIIGSVTIPNYPEGKETPKVTIDDPTQLPDGTQSGTTNVGVTVTYPDGTTDHITVPVTIGEQADNDAYEPQSNGVNKDHGTGVTVEDIIGSVTIPNYPEGKETPKVTIDDPTQLPDGSQSGTTSVGVTVTYPDGTTDHITVPVTIGEQADNDAYEP
ncbi:Rib/alpha-like domain-containing protein, partial [Staphylococcus schleiferi]|uniref:Rib/alpha-like domain-containing protein n=1 Tax=Staphylococcus schleiferi TaxID=1295 RepID=UPI002481267B